jgi:sugar lactone lactonase YvrE
MANGFFPPQSKNQIMKNRNCTVLALALLVVAVAVSQTRAQSVYATPYAFTNFAGLPGAIGANNGTGSAARFNFPTGVVVDSVGNVYVADTDNHTIRKITPARVVTTLAGSAGQSGSANGTGSAARFSNPIGVAVDRAGNVYVGDNLNHTIRKITPAGVVTTLAGSAGQTGSADGTGSAARFSYPNGVAVDSATNVYVADTGNFTIRKITPDGTVTTLTGASAAGLSYPAGVAVDSATNVYVADTGNQTIRKITPGGAVTTLAGGSGQAGSADGSGSAAQFWGPKDVAVDSAGNVYVADYFNHIIRKITPSGAVTTLAGSAGQSGGVDGAGSTARFNLPFSLAVNSAGTLYVADSGNNRITIGTPPSVRFETGSASLTVSNGFFQMRLTGPSGGNVVVEASADFQTWTPMQTNALPSGGLDLSVPLGANQNQFFRAHLAP